MMTAGGVPRARFVGATSQHFTNVSGSGLVSTTLNLAGIPDLEDGDYLMAFSHGQPGYPFGAIAGSGWQQDNFTWATGHRTSVYHRRLTQGIIDSPPTVTGAQVGTIILVAHKGVGKAVRQSVTAVDGFSGQITQPGFVPAADSVGALTYVARSVSDSSDHTPPASWTRRIIQSGAQFRGAVADALGADDYVPSDPIQWTNLGTSFSSLRTAQVYDLRLNP